MFAVAPRPGESEEQQREADRLTQIGRALRELGIGWIAGLFTASERTRGTEFSDRSGPADQATRLAKVKTMQAANEFLEKEYWPEWNAKFTRPPSGEEDLHRPLAEGFELGSALSHVEHRIITNNYTFPYYSKHYQIVREDVQAGMKRQSLRVELWLSGELKARYQGRYVGIQECGVETARGAARPLRAKRFARITMPAAKATGWMVSGTTGRAHRYGR